MVRDGSRTQIRLSGGVVLHSTKLSERAQKAIEKIGSCVVTRERKRNGENLLLSVAIVTDFRPDDLTPRRIVQLPRFPHQVSIRRLGSMLARGDAKVIDAR